MAHAAPPLCWWRAAVAPSRAARPAARRRRRGGCARKSRTTRPPPRRDPARLRRSARVGASSRAPPPPPTTPNLATLPERPRTRARTRVPRPRRLPAPGARPRPSTPERQAAREGWRPGPRARRRCDLPASLSPTRRPVQGTHASARQPLRARPRRLRCARPMARRRRRRARRRRRSHRARANPRRETYHPVPSDVRVRKNLSESTSNRRRDGRIETTAGRSPYQTVRRVRRPGHNARTCVLARRRGADLVSYYEDKYGDGEGTVRDAAGKPKMSKTSKNTSESSARRKRRVERAYRCSVCGEIGHNAARHREKPRRRRRRRRVPIRARYGPRARVRRAARWATTVERVQSNSDEPTVEDPRRRV